MAIVTVRIGRGYAIETKRKLVEALTAAISENLDLPRSEIVVLIEEYARENWANGGIFRGEQAAAPLPDLDLIFRKIPERKAFEKKPAKAPARKAPAKSRSRR